MWFCTPLYGAKEQGDPSGNVTCRAHAEYLQTCNDAPGPWKRPPQTFPQQVPPSPPAVPTGGCKSRAHVPAIKETARQSRERRRSPRSCRLAQTRPPFPGASPPPGTSFCWSPVWEKEGQLKIFQWEEGLFPSLITQRQLQEFFSSFCKQFTFRPTSVENASLAGEGCGRP